MRSKCRYVIYVLALWAVVGEAAPTIRKKLDASSLSLGDTPAAKDSKKEEKVVHAPKKQKKAAPKGLLNASAQDILETIKSINLLLSKDPSGSDRIKLLNNRAMASFSLARKRLVDGKDLKIDSTGKRLLAVAVNDAEAVAKMEQSSKTQKARAFYIRGLAQIYLDNPAEARNSFIQALNIDPKSGDAGWMAVNIGEELFESSKFREAIPYYTNYQDVMDNQERDLANYKLAWCYINLQNPDRAKSLFEELIKQNPEEGFGKDSIKDLAFLVTTYGSEQEALRLSESLFKGRDKSFKINFLTSVLDSYEIQNAIGFHAKILARLLQLEDDPVKKIQYLIAAMRTSKREYASKGHFDAFIRLRNFMTEQGLDVTKRGFEAPKAQLDIETQNLIRAYVETFAGRTKTPEKLSKEQIGSYLKVLFEFYEKFYKDTKIYPIVLKLWLEVCVDGADWPCVDRSADKIIARQDMVKDHQRVALDQLVALENMAADPKSGAIPRLISKLEDFVNSQELSPRWIEISKRLSDYYIKDKNFEKGIPLIERIFTREKSPDTFYRLQWARFEAQKYKEIVAETREPVGKHDPRTVDLKREAALKVAIEARKKDDFKVYSGYIKMFLSLGPSPDKAMAARKDYFYYMIEKDLTKELTKELLSLPDNLRMSRELNDVIDKAWLRCMKEGFFNEAAQIVSSRDKGVRTSVLNRSRFFISKLAMGGRPADNDFNELNPQNRVYVLGILALTKPALALHFLDMYAPLRGKEMRAIGALALRMDAGSWNLQGTKRGVRLMGANFSFTTAPNMSGLKVEEMISKVDIPTRTITNQTTLARYTQDIVWQVRRVRKRIAKDIAGKPVDVQVRAVNKARDLEVRTANFIKNQPMPPGLQGAQIDEYEKGIKEVVKEFEDQAAEFEKLVSQFGEMKEKSESEKAARYLPLPDMTRWPWPSIYGSQEMSGLKELVDNHNYLGGLLVLDLFRPDPLKDERDYFAIRSGILLSSKDNETLRRYVLEELEQSGQNDLAMTWRRMTVGDGQAPAAQKEQENEED